MPVEHEEVVRTLLTLARIIDWELFTKKLLAYTRYSVMTYGGAVFLRERISDYVQESIRLVLDGTRRVEANDEKEFFIKLCGVIDSLVSHDLEKAVRRGLHLQLVLDEPADDARDVIYESSLPSPDDFECDVILRNRVDRFIGKLEGHELQAYARMRANDLHGSAEEYAIALHTTVENVRNMDRRLRRRKNEL